MEKEVIVNQYFPVKMNQKSLTLLHQALFSSAQDGHVDCLQALGAFLDSELDLLSLLQVTESVTLYDGEMDEPK